MHDYIMCVWVYLCVGVYVSSSQLSHVMTRSHWEESASLTTRIILRYGVSSGAHIQKHTNVYEYVWASWLYNVIKVKRVLSF